MNSTSLIKQHPLVSFLGITFVFTWVLISVILVSMPAGIEPTKMPPNFFLLALLAGFGPSLAGFIMTRVTGGKGSIRALLARLGQ